MKEILESIRSLTQTIALITIYAESKKFSTDGDMKKVDLYIEWAAEFETLNKNRVWDCDFYESVDEFTENKISTYKK